MNLTILAYLGISWHILKHCTLEAIPVKHKYEDHTHKYIFIYIYIYIYIYYKCIYTYVHI